MEVSVRHMGHDDVRLAKRCASASGSNDYAEAEHRARGLALALFDMGNDFRVLRDAVS